MRKKQNSNARSGKRATSNSNVKTHGNRSKSSSSRNFKAKDELDKEAMAQSGNDPAWYASDPAILRDAANFPFSYPTGATKVHDLSLYNTYNKAPYADIPGICTLYTTPNTGFNLRATDPINVAAQSIYSFVRHANSGHSNYDAPDLMLYILGMANAYSYLVWCQRLYGYALTYDQRNRYIPVELLRLNNVDADDLRHNLANFRFWINTLIAKIASFAVPATFSIFSRMSFMYSDYYIEGTSVKEQLYQFAPEGFYKFGLDASQKGQLQWVGFDFTQLMKTSDIMTYGNTLFGSIWDEEDFGIMSGDILKAYGDRIIKLTSIPEAYTIAPKFDPVVLTQMKNALILDADGSNISQNSSGLIVQVTNGRAFTATDEYFGTTTQLGSQVASVATQIKANLLKDVKALTVDTDTPSPDVVMEATRLMYGYDAYLGELKLGTEYVHRVALTKEIGVDVIFNQLNVTAQGTIATLLAFAGASEVVKHFHYLPRIFWVVTSNDGPNILEWFDLDNFTVLDNTDLTKLHTAAVINMYAVPSIGKVQ